MNAIDLQFTMSRLMTTLNRYRAENRNLSIDQREALTGIISLLPEGRVREMFGRNLQRTINAESGSGYKVSDTLFGVAGLIAANVEKQSDFSPNVSDTVHRLEAQFDLTRNPSLASAYAVKIHSSIETFLGAAAPDRDTTPVICRIRDMVDRSPRPRFPERMVLLGQEMKESNSEAMQRVLDDVFDKRLTTEKFLKGFYVPNTSRNKGAYWVNTIRIGRNYEREVRIDGGISTISGDPVGVFSIKIPPRLNEERQIAIGTLFRMDPDHQGKKVFTNLLPHLLWLLREIGLYALKVDARDLEDPNAPSFSRHFYAANGFNPGDDNKMKHLKRGMISFLKQEGIWTEGVEMEIMQITELSSIARLEIGDRSVGKEYLAKVIREPLELFFFLRDSYPGWLNGVPQEVFYPIELDQLEEETKRICLSEIRKFDFIPREMLSSYDRFGYHLADWVSNLAAQVFLFHSLIERKKVSTREIPDEILEKMRSIAGVLKLITKYDGKELELAFNSRLKSDPSDLLKVLEFIRTSGINVNYQVRRRS